jgi:endonuclease YncB( thermonuclease family)
MGGWAPLVVVTVLSSVTSSASAQDMHARCGTDAIEHGRVARVVDGRSFVMEDGREIRLASLEVPFVTESAGIASRTALATLVHGETLTLRPAAADADRYGRTAAYAYTTDERRTRSVAHMLLAWGHARVGTQIGDRACAAELLSQERVARAARLGLWGHPDYAIINAGDLTGLTNRQGRFVVAEGKVASVRESGGTIYANFGRRWSQALSVTILKRDERIFTGAGLGPKSFENRQLRVRGWVEVRNGPRIEVSRPEQIEMIERN